MCQASHGRNVNVRDVDVERVTNTDMLISVPPTFRPTLLPLRRHQIFRIRFYPSRIPRDPLKSGILPNQRIYSRSMSRSNERDARDEDDKSELPPITPQEEREYGRVSTRFLPVSLVKLVVIAAWTKDEGGSPARPDEERTHSQCTSRASMTGYRQNVSTSCIR